ncbi:MAG TPA: N-acetylmuramoyl-L-alanine amidase [Candidatus Paceibacterota bacterium]
MRKLFLELFFTFTIIFAPIFPVFAFLVISPESSFPQIAGPFFAEKVSPDDLHKTYAKRKVRVLIVPGHDDEAPGAEFRGVKEGDINLKVGYELYGFLKENKKFEPFILKESNGSYAKWFLDYLSSKGGEVLAFREKLKQAMSKAVEGGKVEVKTRVFHNPAADNISVNLYAVNKLANENNVDIVIHLHVNDYPGRRLSQPGKYSGFAIYVPEDELPNARVSQDVAKSVRDKLLGALPGSNFPGESAVIIPDQKLIAIGSNASRDGASILIEYAYIYEPYFRSDEIRPLMEKELAFQTYRGLRDYFDPSGEGQLKKTSLLPATWQKPLRKGTQGSREVLLLQTALRISGEYPPKGKSLHECAINGNFGNCTEEAVKTFQKRYSIPPVGAVGPLTIKKLNELASRGSF